MARIQLPIVAPLDADGNKIINVGTPTNAADAATMAYVDTNVSGLATTDSLNDVIRDGDFTVTNNEIASINVNGVAIPVGGDSEFTVLSEQTISPAYAFTYNFTSTTGQTSLTIDGIPADMEINARSYTLTEVNPSSGASTTVSIAVASYNATTNILVLSSAITGLALGNNVLTFTRTGMFTQLESDAANTDIEGDVSIRRGVVLPGLPTTDSGRAGTVFNDDGTLVLSGSTAYKDGDARDAVAISHSGDTLTYTDASDTVRTYTPTTSSSAGTLLPIFYGTNAALAANRTIAVSSNQTGTLTFNQVSSQNGQTTSLAGGGSYLIQVEIGLDITSGGAGATRLDLLSSITAGTQTINSASGSYIRSANNGAEVGGSLSMFAQITIPAGTAQTLSVGYSVTNEPGGSTVGYNFPVGLSKLHITRTDEAIAVTAGNSIPSVTSLSTTAATANELVSLTAVDGTNAIGYYFRTVGTTTWTMVGTGDGLSEDAPDWSGLSAYTVNDVVNFRNNIYKRRTQNIPATTGVSIVAGFLELVSLKNNEGITGALGYADTFVFDPNLAAPALNNGVAYRFTIGSGSTRYVIDADPGSTDVTANVGSLYGNGLRARTTRLWQLRLLTPTGTIAPGYTIISVGDTVYTTAQQAAAQTALLAVLATKPTGTNIDNLRDGDQISFGGSPNTAPSEDVSWELISNATLASSRYDLIEGELLSFHQIPDDDTVASLNESDVQRTLFEGRVIGLFTVPFEALGDRAITNGTQIVTVPNGMADNFNTGDYITGRGASFPGIFVGRVFDNIDDDADNAVRFRLTSVRQDNSEAIVALDDTTTVPGLGNLTRVGDIIQVARLENVVEIEDPIQLPAGYPVRFQSRVATNGTLLPFASSLTTDGQDRFVEYEGRLTYDFRGTVTQSSSNIDQLAITVVGTSNEIGSVQGEIHSDLIGYVIHENGDTYFLANPARVGTTNTYNFDVLSVGGGSFAEIFRDITTAVTWDGERTIYLATEAAQFISVNSGEVARWDAAAARNVPEIIRTHSTIGLTSLATPPAADTLFSFVPTTTGNSGISISANNRSFTPNVVLRIADTHSILSMPVSAADILQLRVGDSYFFSAGGTRLVAHIITTTEATSTNGFGRYQEAATDGVVHLYLDETSTRIVSNIGTLGVDRFSLIRHNQNVETEYGWFFQATTFNGITYTPTAVSAFRFYAIDTTDQIILKDGSVEVAIRHLDGAVIAGVAVQEEGTDLDTLADTLNFVGPAITVTGSGSTKTITSTAGAIIPEHSTIPATNTGTSNPNDLVGWEIEIGRPGEGLQRDFVAVNGTSASRIDLDLIDAHPRLTITFSDGEVAHATIIGNSHSTVTTTQLIAQFDVPRQSTAAGVTQTVTIRYFGENTPAAYIASPLTITNGTDVIYKGNEIGPTAAQDDQLAALPPEFSATENYVFRDQISRDGAILLANKAVTGSFGFVPADWNRIGEGIPSSGGDTVSITGGGFVDGEYISAASVSSGAITLTKRAWANAGITLDNLQGVTVSGTPGDNQVLAYDTTTAMWIPQTPSGGAVDSILLTNADNTVTTRARKSVELTRAQYTALVTNSSTVANTEYYITDDVASTSTGIYTEGTWTPVSLSSTSPLFTDTNNVQMANYVRIGNIVHLSARLYITPSSANTIETVIRGIPFPPIVNSRPTGTFSIGNRIVTSGTNVFGIAEIYSNTHIAFGKSDGTPLIYSDFPALDQFGQGQSFNISITYQTTT